MWWRGSICYCREPLSQPRPRESVSDNSLIDIGRWIHGTRRHSWLASISAHSSHCAFFLSLRETGRCVLWSEIFCLHQKVHRNQQKAEAQFLIFTPAMAVWFICLFIVSNVTFQIKMAKICNHSTNIPQLPLQWLTVSHTKARILRMKSFPIPTQQWRPFYFSSLRESRFTGSPSFKNANTFLFLEIEDI